MRTAIVGIAIVAALLSGSARAQEAFESAPAQPRSLSILNWEIAGPIGSFSDYIDDTSLRGVSFEERFFVRNNASIGVSFSWNRFQQTFDLAQVQITNGLVSGPVYRYADMFGIRAIAHYYMGKGGPLQPYLGFGIGGAWNSAYQQTADLSRWQDNFNFIADPEVGFLYWFAQRGAALNIAFRYTYTTATVGQETNAQTLSGIVGLVFGY